MIKNKRIMCRNQKGVTLVEIMVSLGLLLLVSLMVYVFFQSSGNFFRMNTEKADAQAQSRLIFQGMKIDLGAATDVSINDEDVIVLNTEGQVGYGVQGKYFYKKEYNKPAQIAFMNSPVENLDIYFIPTGKNILKMVITAGPKIQFETEIFSENIEEYSTNMTSGTAIILKF